MKLKMNVSNRKSNANSSAEIIPHCKKKGFLGISCRPGCKMTNINGQKECVEDTTVTNECKSIITNSSDSSQYFACNKDPKCKFFGSTKECKNIALTDVYKNKSTDKPHESTFGGAKMTKTKEFVMIKNMKRLIYTGARGGKYVKHNGTFVPLSKAKKAQQK